MRVIKFRGKRIDDCKWTYGQLVNQKTTAWISKYYHQGEWEQVDPETVGQFIGWKDKDGKGKEMFEGDIFKDWLGQLSVIVWKEFRWAFETINGSPFKYRANFHNIGEVIGNKYDNIDLLKKDEK